MSALQQTGFDATDIEYLERQPIGATLVHAWLPDGRELFVKIYGRDASDAASASRIWRSIWYRDERGSLTTSSEQLAEHESLILLACERAGAPAPTVLGWSRTDIDDTLGRNSSAP